jgi:creatinine amidohydrolase
MRPYILAETNWKHIHDQPIDLVILPWGATEAHNYHMPYATDVIEADTIAAESARLAWEQGAKVMVLPTIPFGVNTGQTDILLDINLYPSTQKAILNDIIEVLNRQGIYKLLILNSHGGNDFKTMHSTNRSISTNRKATTPTKWRPVCCCTSARIWFCH